ncbi:hypothetical protein ACTTAL_12765 [Rhodobacter capsulatus]|uniref:hypothetical protein n=1 Tax=Rhodobacter capsulatus TaxID=1061 RepID=UPI0003D2AF1C|nr:hypothetical protein [Rhodobacter capsulatus]ETD87908.1 hypothetical protein U713_16085 [Rhodobacter capsulatus YW2]
MSDGLKEYARDFVGINHPGGTLRLRAMVLGPKSNDDLARDMLAARSKKSKDTWPLADAVRAVAEARSEGLSLLWNEQK